MPTFDHRHALTLEEAHARVARRAFQAEGGPTPGRVGLEPELFPIRVDRAGRPAGRLSLLGPGGVVDTLEELTAADSRLASGRGVSPELLELDLRNGGRLTFEPGGQLEHSTAVHDSVSAAVTDVEAVVSLLQAGFAERGAVLAAAGVDRWHDLATVPQQLAGRYVAMDRYLQAVGPHGAVMMRHTASLQVNLDLGPQGVRQERWLLANLLSPLVTATFASSPGQGMASLRANTWQQLDPTRTGFPSLLVDGPGDDPVAEWAQAALAAHVMLVRRGDGTIVPFAPGLPFSAWVAEGHPDLGWPTWEDLDYHLTTLFFEVRPRGFLEVRTADALPDRWRAAPVVLVTAALYDDRSRREALAILAGTRKSLPELWRRAARAGIRDPELATLAEPVWKCALAGAHRLEPGFIRRDHLETAVTFLERFPFSGRAPADELAELDREDPALGLEWASSGWSRRVGQR